MFSFRFLVTECVLNIDIKNVDTQTKYIKNNYFDMLNLSCLYLISGNQFIKPVQIVTEFEVS